MTEAEVITTICGLGGFFISIWSLQVARRAERGQREAARAANVHERRNSAAVHLQKYSDLLAEVRDATKGAKQEIHTCADDVLMSLAYLVDDVADHDPPRHSRHLFHRMSEQIFDAFRPELSFQYVENVASRFAGVRRQLRELGDSCKQSDQGSRNEDEGLIARLLARLRHPFGASDRLSPEARVLSSPSFVAIFRNLDSRLKGELGRRLMLDSIERVERFCEVQRKLQTVFDSNHERLAAALDRNSSEEFKVEESDQLHARIESEMRSLGLLSRLELNDIKYFRDYDVLDALPEFVYAGSVLFTVAQISDWSRFSSEPMRH